MIQFGVIKGFLRRVYAFPIWLEHPSLLPPPPQLPSTTTRALPPPPSTTTGVEAKRGSTTNLSRLDTTGGGGDRPLFSRATSSQPKMLHSPHSETSTRSAPEPENKVLPLSTIENRDESSTGRRGQRDLPAKPRRNGGVDDNSTNVSPSRTDSPDPTSTSANNAANQPAAPVYPTSLTLMLNGDHHTDEICLKYGIGWRTLQVVLKHLGGGGGSSTTTAENGEGGEEAGYGQSRTKGDGTSTRRTSRETQNTNGFDKSGYGTKVVMLWI